MEDVKEKKEPKTVGEILYHYRQGYTQTELAELSGVNQRTISAIETGKIKQPTYTTAVKLAEVLEIDPLLLLGEKVEKKEKPKKEAEPVKESVAAEETKTNDRLLATLKARYLGGMEKN